MVVIQTPTGTTSMISQLTAVRGPLALWVVLYHFVGKNFAPGTLGWAQPVVERGYLAVDAFFVLSGLIIAHTYAHRVERGEGGAGPFLWARFARVYPAHLAVIALFAVAVGIAHVAGRALVGEYPARDLLAHLSLVHAWGATDGLTWNYPSWSISAEWFAYLLAPAVFLRLRRAGLITSVTVVVLGLGALVVADLPATTTLAAWTDERALIRVAAAFAIGILIARWVPQGERPRPLVLSAGAVTSAAGLLLGLDVVTITGLAVVLTALYAWPSMALPRWTTTLGVWSYGIYLVHALVQVIAQEATRGAVLSLEVRTGILVLAVVTSIAAAGLLHRVVEEPARRWLRDHPPSFARPPGARAVGSAASDRDMQVVGVERVAERPSALPVEGPRAAEARRPGVEQPAGECVRR
jgi:peptidoglycan/LPS O-acetylase OafA/YrhL